jgi:hypothetical protein
MRSISSELISEQRKPTRKPVVSLDVAAYGHPDAVAATELQWQDFAWERLTALGDSTAAGPHALAIPSDGSVCRVRMDGAAIKFQRVASPSGASDWTAAWSNFGTGVAEHPVAIAARSSSVVVFSDDGVNLYRRESADSGATWGGWVSMVNTRPCERGIAAAYKSNGDLAVIHASDVNDPTSLYIQIRTGANWSNGLGQIAGDFAISALALYHDGDWNILALLLDGSYIRLARGIYGDGDQYQAGTFSGWEFINSYKARVDFTGQMTMRLFQTGRAGKHVPTYYEQVSAVNQLRAADNLAVDDPYITYDPAMGALFSFAKDNQPWFYRLRPGTEFKDSDWYKAYPLEALTTHGLAVASDGTYLYATCPSQAWRTALPGAWTPPAAGAGSGTDYPVPASHVLAVRERVEALAAGTLDVTLDNSRGDYNAAGTGSASLLASLKRGSQVTLSIGYKINGSDTVSPAGKYFIEALGYSRKPGESLFTIHAIDAWGLLQRYAFNRPVEWNVAVNQFTVYDLVEKVVQAVGGTLAYKSLSPEITAIYPRMSVNAGQNGAAVLRRLLSLVPDVIFFDGLAGYIVYPQATDAPTYWLRFPK